MLAGAAFAVAALALAVSLWAAGGRPAPGPPSDRAGADRPALPPSDPFRLDSTSQYYVPGMSERGVYYDSSADRHFWFEDGAD